MTSVYQVNDEYLILTKGAIEMMGELCLNKEEVLKNINEASIWAKEGLRILAFAFKTVK